MSLLLTEDKSFLLTETTSQHLLVEPVITATGTIKFSGAVQIYQLGNGWALDSTGGGIIKDVNPDRLIQMALKAGATSVEIL